MHTFEKYWQNILDLLFPKPPRAAELERLSPERLRELLPEAEQSLRHRGIFPLFDYKDERVRGIVWEIKYRRNPALAEAVASILADELLEASADMTMFDGIVPLLAPVPMSKERRKERGFNQTEFLAARIARRMRSGAEYAPELLEKCRHTAPQAELQRAERLKNLKDAYKVKNPEAVCGRHVILIDDVTTTGSTIEEARRTLVAAGAREIIAFTIAH